MFLVSSVLTVAILLSQHPSGAEGSGWIDLSDRTLNDTESVSVLTTAFRPGEQAVLVVVVNSYKEPLTHLVLSFSADSDIRRQFLRSPIQPGDGRTLRYSIADLSAIRQVRVEAAVFSDGKREGQVEKLDQVVWRMRGYRQALGLVNSLFREAYRDNSADLAKLGKILSEMRLELNALDLELEMGIANTDEEMFWRGGQRDALAEAMAIVAFCEKKLPVSTEASDVLGTLSRYVEEATVVESRIARIVNLAE
jgi:hypothetical protein